MSHLIYTVILTISALKCTLYVSSLHYKQFMIALSIGWIDGERQLAYDQSWLLVYAEVPHAEMQTCILTSFTHMYVFKVTQENAQRRLSAWLLVCVELTAVIIRMISVHVSR